ncbi:hypothetical protein A2U01_0063537, partial [Trifolium medium]|nr:hypothetical protein [Trifolium medium]
MPPMKELERAPAVQPALRGDPMSSLTEE